MARGKEGEISHIDFGQKLLDFERTVSRSTVMVKQPILFSSPQVRASPHTFKQLSQDITAEAGNHGLVSRDLFFLGAQFP